MQLVQLQDIFFCQTVRTSTRRLLSSNVLSPQDSCLPDDFFTTQHQRLRENAPIQAQNVKLEDSSIRQLLLVAMSTFVMKEGYGDASKRSRNMALSLCPRIENCVRKVLRKSPAVDKTFFFSDFGVADGVNSAIAVRSVAEVIEKAGKPSEISVVLEDQEENDFRQAFQRVGEALKGIATNVLVSSAGKSFYEQCVPADSTHFAFSTLSVHYMDTARPLKGFQTGYSLPLLRRWHEVGRDPSALTEAERAQFEATTGKAAKDWERFLLLRAKELRIGGRLLIAVTATVPHGSYDRKYAPCLRRDLYEEWALVIDAVRELVESGEIKEEETHNFVVPKHLPSSDDMKAPFLTESSPVRQAGLRLVSCEYTVNRHPRAGEEATGLSEDESRRLAAAHCTAVSRFQAPVLETALSKSPGRSKEDVARLVDAVFERVEKALVASGPGWVSASDISLLILEAEKVSSEA